jgi:membrane protein
MNKRTMTRERPDHKETHDAIQHALSEVHHAVRPRRDGVFAWVVALGAGAIVVWRGVQVALKDPPLRKGGRNRAIGELGAYDPALPSMRPQSDGPLPTERAKSSSEQRSEHNRRENDPSPVNSSQPITPVAARTGADGFPANLPALAKEFIARYNDTDCPARAAALSFFGVLSLVPLLLFAVAALGFFIRDPNQARQYVEHMIAGLLPGREAARAADQVIRQTNLVESARTLMNGKWWTVLAGVLSLVYAVLGLFVNAADPMNAAWEVKETRSFLKLRLVCLEVCAGAGLFFLLSLAVSSGLWHPAHAPWIVNALLSVLYEAVAVALNAVMFTLIYRFLPNVRVTWRAALIGGGVTGVLYEVVKKGFELYLSYFGNINNKMYGALGGIVLLVTWIYYGSMLLLAGAIIAKMYHEHREEGGVRRRSSSVTD